MGMFDFITKPIKSVVGGIAGIGGAGAATNSFQATPYAYDPNAYKPTANNTEVTNEQLQFIRALNNAASNPNASVGMAQSNMARDANIAANNAMGNSAVGTNPALAFREAQIQNEKANQNAAAQGLVTALQERNANYNSLNSAMSGSLANSNIQEANQMKLQEDKEAEQARQDQVNSGVAAQNATMQNSARGGALQAVAGGLANLALPGLGGAASAGGTGAGGSVTNNDLANAAVVKFEGGEIPGKAPVKGDSLKNDTVPAMLSPGEVVIPKHVMESKDPAAGAAKFIEAILKQSKAKGPSNPAGFGAVLKAHAELGRTLKLCMGGRV